MKITGHFETIQYHAKYNNFPRALDFAFIFFAANKTYSTVYVFFQPLTGRSKSRRWILLSAAECGGPPVTCLDNDVIMIDSWDKIDFVSVCMSSGIASV